MMWLLAGLYCLVLWLVFAKWKLLRLSLPLAIVAASVGPTLILALLFCAQYYHPLSKNVCAFQNIVPILPQMKQAGRVAEIVVQANAPVKAGEVLFEVDRVPFQTTVDRLTAAVAEAGQGVAVAESSIEVARATLKRAAADLKFMTRERDRGESLVSTKAISQAEFDQLLTRYQQAASALEQATAGIRQADLAVELAKTRVAQTQAALNDAKYDLQQTTVRAPSDGRVVNLQLQPGMLVGGPGAVSVMSFVQDRAAEDRGVVVAMIGQKNFLLIRPQNYAEVVLDDYPGRIFTGRVLTTIDASGTGQLAATGDLPEDLGTAATRFAVRIKLDDAEELRLPAGSSGMAAVYTDHAPIAGIPVMVILRMQTWLKFVL